MEDSHSPGQARAPSRGDSFTLSDRRLCHCLIGLAVVLAAVVIPGFSIYVGEGFENARNQRAQLAAAGPESGAHVDSPEALAGVVDENLSNRERRQLAERLGFRKDMPAEEMKRRLDRYARSVSQGRYDAIPQDIKQMAIERFGEDRLRQLKKKFEQMGLSREQMIQYGMRELMGMP